jgi:hypothetical protein
MLPRAAAAALRTGQFESRSFSTSSGVAFPDAAPKLARALAATIRIPRSGSFRTFRETGQNGSRHRSAQRLECLGGGQADFRIRILQRRGQRQPGFDLTFSGRSDRADSRGAHAPVPIVQGLLQDRAGRLALRVETVQSRRGRETDQRILVLEGLGQSIHGRRLGRSDCSEGASRCGSNFRFRVCQSIGQLRHDLGRRC